MYGQSDWTSRLISVFVRFFVLIGRFIALGAEAVIYMGGIVLWVVAPILFGVLFIWNLLRGASGPMSA